MSSTSRTLATTAVALAAAVFTAGAQAASAYSETWDMQGDLAGWGPNTIHSNVFNPGGGGNPGGFLQSRRSGDFSIGAMTQLAAATGSFAGAPMWTASVDLNEFAGDAGPVFLRFRYKDSTFNGWKYQLTDSLAQNQWASFSVMFNPMWTDAQALAAGWSKDLPDGFASVTWAETMADVYTTEVRFDGSRSLLVGIDNFSLAPIPEPGTWALMAVGLAAMGAYSRRRPHAASA
jgi:hypothetical protein